MSHQATVTAIPTDDHHGVHHPHVLPLWLLFGTFAALIVLTVVTVVASDLSLGAAEIWVSMGIATVKATLVALIFMHLLYDKRFNLLLMLFTLVFGAIFVGMTLVDSKAYQSEVDAYETPAKPQ